MVKRSIKEIAHACFIKAPGIYQSVFQTRDLSSNDLALALEYRPTTVINQT
jgi:hypothetical protein